jgi:hypothetical protein
LQSPTYISYFFLGGGSAIRCSFLPPLPSIFSDCSFLVPHPVNQDDQHLLAHKWPLTSQSHGSFLKENNWLSSALACLRKMWKKHFSMYLTEARREIEFCFKNRPRGPANVQMSVASAGSHPPPEMVATSTQTDAAGPVKTECRETQAMKMCQATLLRTCLGQEASSLTASRPSYLYTYSDCDFIHLFYALVLRNYFNALVWVMRSVVSQLHGHFTSTYYNFMKNILK